MKIKPSIAIRTLLLVLIGTSITFSTLHSHGHIEWEHTDSRTDTGSCLTEYTNVCPICGTLHEDAFLDIWPTPAFQPVLEITVLQNDSQLIDPYTGSQTARAPPALI